MHLHVGDGGGLLPGARLLEPFHVLPVRLEVERVGRLRLGRRAVAHLLRAAEEQAHAGDHQVRHEEAPLLGAAFVAKARLVPRPGDEGAPGPHLKLLHRLPIHHVLRGVARHGHVDDAHGGDEGREDRPPGRVPPLPVDHVGKNRAPEERDEHGAALERVDAPGLVAADGAHGHIVGEPVADGGEEAEEDHGPVALGQHAHGLLADHEPHEENDGPDGLAGEDRLEDHHHSGEPEDEIHDAVEERIPRGGAVALVRRVPDVHHGAEGAAEEGRE
mmetsp:Transcript_68317/g.216149  ORF Transcript_68317/g.216149 Transcript_68317/m.216149 type:complete len:274 (+) Transcript_68317:89-910(+)